jgi:DNA-binding response OmpR family regulator
MKCPDMARILSVEDDPEVQHLLSIALQGQGYELHYAFGGREGYEKALALNPDLILADMKLPVLNGVEMIMLLKTHPQARDIPIVVMTSFSKDANFVESRIKPLGVVEYLRKPIDIEELVHVIKRLLSARAPREQESQGPRKGVVRVDPRFRTVWINDRLVATLPPKRFGVLLALVEKRGSVTREALIASAWPDGDGSKNVLEKTIQRLREDLGPLEAPRIRTTADGYELIS